MSKRYVCVKSFAVPLCDDDGFTIENRHSVIESGTVWEITNNDMIGGEIHLEEVGRPWHWLEIFKEHFEVYFIREVNKNA